MFVQSCLKFFGTRWFQFVQFLGKVVRKNRRMSLMKKRDKLMQIARNKGLTAFEQLELMQVIRDLQDVIEDDVRYGGLP